MVRKRDDIADLEAQDQQLDPLPEDQPIPEDQQQLDPLPEDPVSAVTNRPDSPELLPAPAAIPASRRNPLFQFDPNAPRNSSLFTNPENVQRFRQPAIPYDWHPRDEGSSRDNHVSPPG